MSALPQTREDLFDTIATAYGLGPVVRTWAAAHGIENTNYFLVSRSAAGVEQTHVVTLLNQRSYAGSAYTELLDRADRAGLPVPALLRTLDGKASLTLHGQQIRLSRWLPGHHVFNASNRQVAAVGRTLARLHRALAGLTDRVAPYPRDLHWLQQQADRAAGRIRWTTQALIRDTLVSIDQLLRRTDVQQLPTGIIHGDLFRDNVLFEGQNLSGVLDFHHAATGFWVYDLAVVANDWCTDSSGMLNPERVSRLLASYHAIRPLSSRELWFFPLFAQYAALTFLLSRLVVQLQPDRDPARCKNPEEFERILEQHRAHYLYVDPRQLAASTDRE